MPLGVTTEVTVGEMLVGVGTILLAGFTARLAWLAGQEIEKAEESLAVARETLKAQDMPYVVASPQDAPALHFWLDDPAVLAIGLWNVGKGPAIVHDVRLVVSGEDLLLPLDSQYPVHAGGRRDTELRLERPFEPGDMDGAEGELHVYFTDASGDEYVTTSTVEIFDEIYMRCRSFERSKAHPGYAREMRDPDADLR